MTTKPKQPCIHCHKLECYGQCLQNIYPQPKQMHTPGPWAESDRVNTIGYMPICITDKDYMPIAEVRGQENARLIAAAPELLEACKLAYEELNEIHARDGVPYTHLGYKASVTQECFTNTVEKCRQAIAKATSTEGK